MSKKSAPSMDEWIKEAKAAPVAADCGMFLFHNGIVRQTARAQVRDGKESAPVTGMVFSYDEAKVAEAEEKAMRMTGIKYVRTWLNEGELEVGDDIMLVLIGGDTRPHVADALQALVSELKGNCVTEAEKF